MNRFRAMFLNSLSIGTILFINHSAQASEKAAYESQAIPFAQDHNDEIEAKFSANKENPELGLAWVRYLDSYKDDHLPGQEFDSVTKVTALEVPGLSYKADSDQIVFKKANGSITVCATDINMGTFTRSTYKSTGKCELKVMKTKVKDFKGHEEWAAVVSLVLHE